MSYIRFTQDKSAYNKLLELLKEGRSTPFIAAEFNCHRTSIIYWRRKLGYGNYSPLRQRLRKKTQQRVKRKEVVVVLGSHIFAKILDAPINTGHNYEYYLEIEMKRREIVHERNLKIMKRDAHLIKSPVPMRWKSSFYRRQ